MGTENEPFTRRWYLAAVGAGSVAATAGCLGSVFGDSGEVVLDEQQGGYNSDSLPYPNYGESFPDIGLPDPIAETMVSTAEPPLDEETLLVTAFYAFCPSECLLLIRALADVQAALLEADVDVTILAITFLVNPDRYVERVYHDDAPDIDRASSDAETVAAAYR